MYLELTHSDGEIIPVKIEVMKELKDETENESESDEFSIIEKLQIKENLTKEYGIKNVEVKKWTR